MSRPPTRHELGVLANALLARYHPPDAVAFIVEVTGRPFDAKLTTDEVAAVFARLEAEELEAEPLPDDPSHAALAEHLARLVEGDLPAFLARLVGRAPS